MTGSNTRRKINYTWVIVALCFLMVFVALGFCSTNKGLYLAPITEALQIHRSLFAFGDSIRYIATAIVNVFFGSLLARFGSKKLILAGFVSLFLCMLCYSLSTSVVGFYIGSAFLGIGVSWTSTSMVGHVVNKWCRSYKGTIMGAVLAANGIGGALAAQIVAPIIYGSTFGYRTAYRLVMVILAVTATVILVLFRENPPDESAQSAAAAEKKKRGESWVGMDYRVAVRQPFFYVAALCIFLTGLVLQSVTTIAAAHMRDVGLDAAYIATVVSVHSLTLAAFKFLTGFLYDRFGLRFTSTLCNTAGIVAMMLLALVTPTASGKVLAMGYSVISSVAMPLETIMLPLYTAGMFGQKSYSRMLGLIVSINTAGYAVGAPLINTVFDLTGSYRPALYICAGIMTFVMVTLQFVLNAANREKKKILAAEEN